MQYFYIQIEYNFKIKMVTIFWMILSFLAKTLAEVCHWAKLFAETFLYEKEACSYIDEVFFAAVHKKNNISTSCVLNGFKYILIISG